VVGPARLKGTELDFYPLSSLPKAGATDPSLLPMTVKVLLEGLIRLAEAGTTEESNIAVLSTWPATPPPDSELPFLPARVLMQDFTGVPAVAAQKIGRTLCLNPGSDYSADVLRGAIVDLAQDGAFLDFLFTTG